MVNEYRSASESEQRSPYNQYIPPGHAEGASPSPWEQRNQQVSPASSPGDVASQRLAAGQYVQTVGQQQTYAKVQAMREAEQARAQQQQTSYAQQAVAAQAQRDQQQAAMTSQLPAPFTSKPGQQTDAQKIQEAPDVMTQGLPAPFMSTAGTTTPPGIVPHTMAFIPGIGAPLVLIGEALKPETQKIIVQTATDIKDLNIGGIYEGMNRILAPATTDPTGIGKYLQNTPDIKDAGIPGEIGNFAKGVYSSASQRPLDLAISAGLGAGLGAGINLVKLGVARAAGSAVPGVSTAGRALSTPLARDLGSLGMKAAGAVFVGSTVMEASRQPTSSGKGEVVGAAAVQLAGFATGYGSVKSIEPPNQYAGREFFSGKPAMGPIEKLQFRAETAVRSLSTEKPSAYRDVARIAESGRFTEPQVKAEPNFKELTRSGKYATEIKDTLVEQPHSVIGSSSVRQQYAPEIVKKAGLRVGKDVDALTESPTKATASLSKRTGLSPEESKSVLDVHPIPENYPLKASKEIDTSASESSALTRLFGDPYRRIGFPRSSSEVVKGGKDYPGKLTYEQSQVQFGRKSAAVSAFIEDPLAKGYRSEKDVFDLVTGYQAQRAVDISRGTPPGKYAESDAAIRRLMDTQITRGTVKGQSAGDNSPVITETLGEMFRAVKQPGVYERAIPGTESRIPVRGAIPAAVSSAFSISPALASPAVSGTPRTVPAPSGMAESGQPVASQAPIIIKSPIVSTGRFSTSPPIDSPSLFGSPQGSSPGSPDSSPRSSLPGPLVATVSSIFRSPGIIPPYGFTSVTGSPSTRIIPPSSPPPGSPSKYPTSFPPSSPPPVYPTILSPPPTSPPIIPGAPESWLPGGFGSNQLRRKRSTHFTEMFMVGLDMSVRKRSMAPGKSFVSPEPKKKKAQKKRIVRKKK